MLKKATTIKEIRKYCTPKPLTQQDLKDFYIDTNDARNPEEDIFSILKNLVTAEEENRILFCGHKGCGKSTELNNLKNKLRDEMFCISFSLEQVTNTTTVTVEELLLIIAEITLKKVKEDKIDINKNSLKDIENSFEKIYEYFADKKETTENKKEIGCEANAELNASTDAILAGLIKTILGLKVKAQIEGKILKTKSSSVIIERQLIKRQSDLMSNVNELIEEVKKALPSNQRLLIIVEDLDKLNIAVARDIFIQNCEFLKINASVIYTIPIFLFYAPDAQACINNFDAYISLPMIKIKNIDGKNNNEGYQTIQKIIYARLDKKLIDDDALDMLIKKTGGVLRHCFEALQRASMANSALKKKKLGTQQIEYGLNRLFNVIWKQVTPPYEPLTSGVIKIEELHKRLSDYYKMEENKKAVKPAPDTINQILLMSSALIEYINGKERVIVHPILEEAIKELKWYEEDRKTGG